MSEREVNFGNANAKGIMPSYVLWCVLLCVKAFRLSLSLSLFRKKKKTLKTNEKKSAFFLSSSFLSLLGGVKKQKKRGGGMGDFFKGPPLSQKERQASFSLSMISLFFCVCRSFSFFLSSSFFF